MAVFQSREEDGDPGVRLLVWVGHSCPTLRSARRKWRAVRFCVTLKHKSIPTGDELSHAQFFRRFQRRAALAADDRAAVSAGKRIRDFGGAFWAIEGLG